MLCLFHPEFKSPACRLNPPALIAGAKNAEFLRRAALFLYAVLVFLAFHFRVISGRGAIIWGKL
jgi:hypothetical protein